MNKIIVEIAVGELLDKISILEIKSDKITNHEKLFNIHKELTNLNKVKDQALSFTPETEVLYRELKKTNEKLWQIEDEIRACESERNFGEEFIQLARSVYLTNDYRCRIKRELNEKLGSDLMEEKSYQEYSLEQ